MIGLTQPSGSDFHILDSPATTPETSPTVTESGESTGAQESPAGQNDHGFKPFKTLNTFLERYNDQLTGGAGALAIVAFSWNIYQEVRG